MAHALPAPPPLLDASAVAPSALDEYLFDLRGYLLVPGFLDAAEVAEGNALIDSIPGDLPRAGWHGWVQREDHPEHRGISYQQIYELGGVFERMIDHPRLLNTLDRFVGGHDTHDRYQGPMAIDENFFSVRGPGEAIPIHAGGHELASRSGYRYHNGRFLCGEVNVLTAFSDIGAGDGATMVIPGSHKANFIHPAFLLRDQAHEWSNEGGGSAEDVEGAIEIHLRAGDALVFVDALCHGSAKRQNPGERRISVYRYGSGWCRTRFGHQPSPEALQRLGPLARKLVQPRDPLRPPGAAPRW